MLMVHVVFEKSSSRLIGDADKTLYFYVSKIIFDAGIKIKLLQYYVIIAYEQVL